MPGGYLARDASDVGQGQREEDSLAAAAAAAAGKQRSIGAGEGSRLLLSERHFHPRLPPARQTPKWRRDRGVTARQEVLGLNASHMTLSTIPLIPLNGLVFLFFFPSLSVSRGWNMRGIRIKAPRQNKVILFTLSFTRRGPQSVSFHADIIDAVTG